MNLTFKKTKATVVTSSIDMRAGYRKLNMFAIMNLGIDVSHGEDIVVFFGRHSDICKIIAGDSLGTALFTRRLHHGRFQRLLARMEGEAKMELEISELESLLDGRKIFVKRDNFLVG